MIRKERRIRQVESRKRDYGQKPEGLRKRPTKLTSGVLESETEGKRKKILSFSLSNSNPFYYWGAKVSRMIKMQKKKKAREGISQTPT